MTGSEAKHITAIALGLAASASCAMPLDRESAKGIAGTYAVACGKSEGPRLKISIEALEVEAGNKRIRARNPDYMLTFFGNSPPADFEGALSGAVRPDGGLVFVFYRDKIGSYIKLDGAPAVLAPLGKDVLRQKFRRCT